MPVYEGIFENTSALQTAFTSLLTTYKMDEEMRKIRCVDLP
jgi:hypothetical protein